MKLGRVLLVVAVLALVLWMGLVKVSRQDDTYRVEVNVNTPQPTMPRTIRP